MAIDLPAGIEPALTTIQEIRSVQSSQSFSSGKVINATVAGYSINVYGNTLLTDTEVQSALQQGKTLSESVWYLHYAFINSGHRLTRLRYFLESDTLHIRVIEGYLSGIKGQNSLTRFFWDVDGQSFPLHRLESARILANIQAKREGLTVSSDYTPEHATSDQIQLTLQSEKDTTYRPFSIEAEVGNPGNRFVGRHFLLANAKLNTRAAQWKLAINKSLNQLDDSDTKDGKLTGYQISSSALLPIGLLNIGASQTDYEYRNISGNPIDAEVAKGHVQLQELLYSDPSRRNLLSQKLIFVNSESTSEVSGQKIVDERYFVGELGAEQFRRLKLYGLDTQIRMSVNIRKGLSDNTGTLGLQPTGVDRDAGFLMLQPKAKLTFKPAEYWGVKLIAASQFSDSEVPEQQQWTLGGSQRLRAWLPGSLVGDSGHYLRIETYPSKYEFSHGFALLPSIFIEGGQSEFESNNPQLPGRQRAIDAGLNLAITIGNHWALELTTAQSISDSGLSERVLNDNKADFYFSLKTTW